ncbi:hypothetical protein EV121DRAFT_200556 [Schizophyllum commune]
MSKKAKSFAASSLLDLKAELAQQEADAKTRQAAGGKKEYIAGGVKRPEKKTTAWLRANKGVKSRAERDLQMEAVDRPTLESSRARLEEKARIYDKLKRGQTAGLDSAHYDALLVDFDAKGYEAHSDDEDESLTVPRAPDENDPIVEYVDELGRTRTARKSEVPREFMYQFEEGGEEDSDEDLVIRNPEGFFPTYHPTEERVAQIEKDFAEQTKVEGHYDARGENRARGAAFYAFSQDEEERKRQMEELKAARDETRTVRQEVGAEEPAVGEVVGMRWDQEAVGDAKGKGKAKKVAGTEMSKAMEKRKREREERQRMLQAKRRKLRGEPEPEPSPAPASPPPVSQLQNSTPADPFAALEAKESSGKRDEADAFLASLETELRGGTK